MHVCRSLWEPTLMPINSFIQAAKQAPPWEKKLHSLSLLHIRTLPFVSIACYRKSEHVHDMPVCLMYSRVSRRPSLQRRHGSCRT